MKRSRPLLFVAPSPQEAWEDVIAPWFDQVLPGAWQRELPSLVVVPTRGQANDIKARLIARGSSHLGLQFVTPSSLRALLARDDTNPAAQPELMRLLLAIAASEMEDRPNESEALAGKAVARAPAPLLRALDRLETAGWKFEELGLSSFAPVVQRFNELLKKCDFVLRGESDRSRLQQHTPGRREFSHLLIWGFDGAHWAEWFLLRSALELAKNATIVLEEPRENFSDVDICWIGSWEEVSGEAQRAPRATTALGDSLFSELEMRGGTETAKRFDFLIGTNFSEQAEAITRQCVRYLADEKCTRLGVIFPGSGALPRLVTSSLERLEIPHNDGLGHIVPGIFELGNVDLDRRRWRMAAGVDEFHAGHRRRHHPRADPGHCVSRAATPPAHRGHGGLQPGAQPGREYRCFRRAGHVRAHQQRHAFANRRARFAVQPRLAGAGSRWLEHGNDAVPGQNGARGEPAVRDHRLYRRFLDLRPHRTRRITPAAVHRQDQTAHRRGPRRDDCHRRVGGYHLILTTKAQRSRRSRRKAKVIVIWIGCCCVQRRRDCKSTNLDRPPSFSFGFLRATS